MNSGVGAAVPAVEVIDPVLAGHRRSQYGRNDTFADRVRAFIDGSSLAEDPHNHAKSIAEENDSGRNK